MVPSFLFWFQLVVLYSLQFLPAESNAQSLLALELAEFMLLLVWQLGWQHMEPGLPAQMVRRLQALTKAGSLVEGKFCGRVGAGIRPGQGHVEGRLGWISAATAGLITNAPSLG